MPASKLGVTGPRRATVSIAEQLDAVIGSAAAAATSWVALGPARERADVLRRAAGELERRRADLIEVMAREAGKTIDQADPEVSEAVDFANYYAEPARRSWTAIDGATFHPGPSHRRDPALELPGRDPGRLHARRARRRFVGHHQAGRQARRCAARSMVEALWEAGVPRDVLQLVELDGAARSARS